MNSDDTQAHDPYLQSLLIYAKDVRNDIDMFIADLEAGKPESIQRMQTFEHGLNTLQNAVKVYAAHYAQQDAAIQKPT